MKQARIKGLIEGLIILVFAVLSCGLFLLSVRPSPEDFRAFYSWENLTAQENFSWILAVVLIVAIVAVGGFALWWMPRRRQLSTLRRLGIGAGVLVIVGGFMFARLAYEFYSLATDPTGRQVLGNAGFALSGPIIFTMGMALMLFVTGLGTIYGSLRYERLKARWNELFDIIPVSGAAAGD